MSRRIDSISPLVEGPFGLGIGPCVSPRRWFAAFGFNGQKFNDQC